MKKIIILSLIVLILIASFAVAAEVTQMIANVENFKIVVNGEEKKFDMPIVTINDRTYLPLREMAETLGIDIEWIEKENKIAINYEIDEKRAGDLLFPFKKDRLYGYMDKQGKIAIKSQFYTADIFVDGVGVVQKMIDGEIKETLINTKGELILPFMYSYVSRFENGIALASIDGKVSDSSEAFYIDKNGQPYFGEKYYNADPFSEGVAPIQKRYADKWRFINEKGEYVNDKEYTYANAFQNGYSLVSNNYIYEGMIDRNFNWVITDDKYESIDMIDSKTIIVKKEGKEGIIDLNGNVILGFIYDDIRYEEGNLISVKKDGLYGYIDKNTHETVIPFQFNLGCEFHEGYAQVKIKDGKEEKWGLINEKGGYVIEPMYQYVDACRRGLIEIWSGGDSTYYLNTKGEKIVPHE